MATLAETFQERTNVLRAPIPGASPGGADITFDPDFERIKAEIDKQTGMSGTPPNWRDIETVGAELLSSKAKDMRVATWMTVAKMQRGSWEGFAEGLSILNAMVSDYWDTMFPEAKRARARANLVSWLIDQSHSYFEAKEVSGGDGEAVKLADEMLNAIDAVLAAKLGDLYSGLGKLRGTMREKVRAIAAAAPPPPVEAAPPSTSSASSSSSSASAPAASTSVGLPVGNNAEDAAQSIYAAGSAIIANATVLRKADPSQPWAYRLQRIGAWIGIRQLPPTEEGLTRLPPPPADVQSRIKSLFESGKWLDVLHLCEENVGEYLYWFDLHRVSSAAMDRLGANFLEAREAIGREVVALTQRLPAVVKLSFSDGSPMFEPATKAWLDEEGKKYGGGGGSGASAAVSAEDEEVAKRFESARELVTSGKAAEGLGLALSLANRSADARARFRSRLAVATMALGGGKLDVARPMLESLMAEVDAHHLEVWEPALCVPLYSNLLTCLRAAIRAAKETVPPELAARELYLFDKLCRLDPAAALRLAGD